MRSSSILALFITALLSVSAVSCQFQYMFQSYNGTECQDTPFNYNGNPNALYPSGTCVQVSGATVYRIDCYANMDGSFNYTTNEAGDLADCPSVAGSGPIPANVCDNGGDSGAGSFKVICSVIVSSSSASSSSDSSTGVSSSANVASSSSASSLSSSTHSASSSSSATPTPASSSSAAASAHASSSSTASSLSASSSSTGTVHVSSSSVMSSMSSSSASSVSSSSSASTSGLTFSLAYGNTSSCNSESETNVASGTCLQFGGYRFSLTCLDNDQFEISVPTTASTCSSPSITLNQAECISNTYNLPFTFYSVQCSNYESSALTAAVPTLSIFIASLLALLALF